MYRNGGGSAVDGAETDAGWTYNPENGFRVTTNTTTTVSVRVMPDV